MDKFPLTIPERRPLRAGCHLIVSEHSAYVGNRILEERRGGKVVEVRAVGCKLELTEDRVGIWRHLTLKEDFNDRRDERRRGDRRCIGDGRRIGNGWNERDRGGKCDRGTQRNAGRYGDRRRGRKIPICHRLAVAVQNECEPQKY